MSKKILIYDDDPKVAKRWHETLKRTLASLKLDYETIPLDENDFERCVADLEKRRAAARKQKGKQKFDEMEQNDFDEVDMLILDYDLLNPKSETRTFVTGERVAYLARCYSRCGSIIGLNQFANQMGKNGFDLTLKGHLESYADLNLGDEQLSNKGLWKEPWKGFRPWYWPMLPRAVEALEARVKEVQSNLDEPILSFLGFPDEISRILPRSTLEFLGKGKAPEKTTFREFVLKSGNGLRGKDKPLNDEAIARIAAARIAKWLERLVLPGQDILVDAPHLVSRFPSLLKGNVNDIETWNKTASFVGVSRLGMDHKKIEKFRFIKENWLSRPAWLWSQISGFEKIQEVRDPWVTTRPDFIFCEDISRFLPRDAAREFVADLPSQFTRRFIVDLESKEGRRFAGELEKVEYAPRVRLSL